MKATKSKKLDDLEKQIANLIVQKQAEEARIKSQAKKDETRRKILVGAYYLDKAQINGDMPKLIKKLDYFLLHRRDRLLFGLPEEAPKNKPEEVSPKTDSTPSK